jgi:hypothetical protein
MERPSFRQHGFAMRLPGGGHAPMRSHLTRRRGDLPLIDPTDRLSASGRSTRQYNDTQSIVTWVRPSSRNTILTGVTVFACSVYGVQNPDYVVAVEQMIFT